MTARSARSFGGPAPGEEAVVLEAGLAVAEPGAVEGFDAAAGGFEDRLAGGGVPFHRRAEARVEVALAGGDQAEFEGAAAQPPLPHRVGLQKFAEAAAVLVRAAVHDDEPVFRR